MRNSEANKSPSHLRKPMCFKIQNGNISAACGRPEFCTVNDIYLPSFHLNSREGKSRVFLTEISLGQTMYIDRSNRRAPYPDCDDSRPLQRRKPNTRTIPGIKKQCVPRNNSRLEHQTVPIHFVHRTVLREYPALQKI